MNLTKDIVPIKAEATHSSGTLRKRYQAIEMRRQSLLLYLGNIVTGTFLFSFGFINYSVGLHTLTWFCLVHGTIIAANICLYRFTRYHQLANFGFAYCLLALFGYLLVTGGADNTGALWGYPIAVLALSLLRAWLRLAVMATMLGITLLLFSVPVLPESLDIYSLDFKLRYTASFLAIILFTGLHEYARAQSQTALEDVSEHIDRLSYTDVLTNLPNRRFMLERLDEENSRNLRHTHDYAILYGDIDDFKQINDYFGHATGDAALCAVAKVIRANLRQRDIVCRWGGEEFLVLLPGTGPALALEVAEKLRLAVAAIDFCPDGRPHHIGISFGVQTTERLEKVEHIIQQADHKLYRAKHAGKNQSVA